MSDVSEAFLQQVDLSGAKLLRANFRSADIRGGSFVGSQLKFADLTSANLRNADLQKADLQSANLQDADLFGADLRKADLTGAHLAKADLRNADLQGAKWQKIADAKLVNVFGIKNAPPGFLDCAVIFSSARSMQVAHGMESTRLKIECAEALKQTARVDRSTVNL